MAKLGWRGAGEWLGVLALAWGCGREAEEVGASADYRLEAPQVSKGAVLERDAAPAYAAGDLAALVSGNTAFALELLARARAAAPDENVALAPYSISQALGMLYAGARGHTARELEAALHYTLEPAALHRTFNALDGMLGARNGDILLRNANQVWAAAPMEVRTEYLDVLTRDYGAPLARLSFASDPELGRSVINGWVHEATERRIAELLPAGSIEERTRLVLSNAMYMDAPWELAFDAARTAPGRFSLASGAAVEVPMMQLQASLPSAEAAGWQAVELGYRGGEVAMLVVVPTELAEFEAGLTPGLLAEIRGALQSDPARLALPRFAFGFHTSLRDALAELGVSSLFTAPDLTGMSDEPLVVASIEHEAIVEVDEDGTRAAAATAVVVQTRGTPRSIEVNRPFLFFVIDEPTGSVLFGGRVLDPR